MEKRDAKMGMGMMQSMMKGMDGMPDECMKMMQQMMGSFTDTANSASFATPEIRGLFEEWARILEEDIVAFVKERGRTNPSAIVDRFKISEESVLFIVSKLARERKLAIGEIRVSTQIES